MNKKIIKSILLLGFILRGQEALAQSIKVIQFNTWGVPIAVKDTFRYWEAMDAIESRDPDLIVLQEIFSRKGKGAFHSPNYPFEVRGPLGFPRPISSGLRILSKHPILASAQVSFCKCTGADCLSKKGAVIAVVLLPSGSTLNLLVTHLDAGTKDSVRISQMEQMRSLLENYGDPNAPLIVSGDFNFSDRSEAYDRMLNFFQTKDTWTETHSSSEPGYTYDAYENRYAREYSIKTNTPLIKERIDFVLYRSGVSGSLSAKRTQILFKEEPLYSDHYGIEAEFTLSTEARLPFVAQ